jgi:peptidoglycan hydrolase-like protein with peptidoglycan-binding domain
MPKLRDIPLCATTTVVDGLSRQILAEINVVRPGILVNFSDLNINIGARQFPFLQQRAKEALARAISSRGIPMTVNSAYRTCAQQFLLHRRIGSCGTTRAAKPGRSNHESGLALDVDDSAGWRPFLRNQGWAWFGPDDAVHYDFVGGGTPIGNVGIKAFQTLWNRNVPDQPIGDDGVYGPETERKLDISPSEGFNSGETPRRILRLTSPLMQGGDVRIVQVKLKDLGFLTDTADGIFGQNTAAAIRAFQTAQGIDADGVVGEDTYERLGIE